MGIARTRYNKFTSRSLQTIVKKLRKQRAKMQITLKAARVNKGLTQREAAKYLKVNFQTISKY